MKSFFLILVRLKSYNKNCIYTRAIKYDGYRINIKEFDKCIFKVEREFKYKRKNDKVLLYSSYLFKNKSSYDESKNTIENEDDFL